MLLMLQKTMMPPLILFLLVEPMGLGKLYGNVRNYLMVWPFGYSRK